ncbi:MAG: hypothetical protein M1820_000283 [Bogoriella megaspora]|nr:MAG: hypothetical protein M1820_000283 [Bogoriella megaspora]
MLRSGAPRAILGSLTRTSKVTPLSPFTTATRRAQSSFNLSCSRSTCTKRPVLVAKPVVTALQRYATKTVDKVDHKSEEKVGQKTLRATPETVSSTSSVHPIFDEVGASEGERDVDMMAGIRSDMKTIAETFSLKDVPREPYVLGLAGVLPYLATSLSTVYCAWEINHAAATGSGLLMSGQTAELLLHVLEPLQIGYGAVIISFLGAIHWGLEYAGFGGHHGYRRYAVGVIAPAVAWPTILLPAEYALIAQFLAFNFLYYNDSRARRRGWAPEWYGVYRFVLTFIVGGSIVISLIGRGQVVDEIGRLPGPAERVRALRESQVESLEKEESARVAMTAEKEEEEEDEESEE